MKEAKLCSHTNKKVSVYGQYIERAKTDTGPDYLEACVCLWLYYLNRANI